MDATEHQRNVRQAMEGNIATYFHPSHERIAFLYPNGVINIFNSQTWENLDSITVKTVKPEGGMRSNDELRQVADMKMHSREFDREGRVQEARF